MGFKARDRSSRVSGVVAAGDRVIVRRPRASDQSRLRALIRDSREFHQPFVDLEDTPEFYRRYTLRMRSLDASALFVFRQTDMALVGVFNISQIIRGPLQSAFLGYYAHADFARRGYMSEGLELVLHHAFCTIELHRIEANIQPTNRASKKLVERAGFRLEGFSPRYLKMGDEWCDHERWALTVEDWRARLNGA